MANCRDFHTVLNNQYPGASSARREVARRSIADKETTVWANFELLAHTAGEASADFYHISARSFALWAQSRNMDFIEVSSQVRVLLPSAALKGLLDECAALIDPVTRPA